MEVIIVFVSVGLLIAGVIIVKAYKSFAPEKEIAQRFKIDTVATKPDEGPLFRLFKAHDAVPSWLIDYEPMAPGAIPPEAFAFHFDTIVVEAFGRYWLLPAGPGLEHQEMLYARGGRDCRFFAADRPVVMPLKRFVMNPRESV